MARRFDFDADDFDFSGTPPAGNEGGAESAGQEKAEAIVDLAAFDISTPEYADIFDMNVLL